MSRTDDARWFQFLRSSMSEPSILIAVVMTLCINQKLNKVFDNSDTKWLPIRNYFRMTESIFDMRK